MNVALVHYQKKPYRDHRKSSNQSTIDDRTSTVGTK